MSTSPTSSSDDMEVDTPAPNFQCYLCATSPSSENACDCTSNTASSVAETLLAHLAAVPAVAAVGKPNLKVYVPASFQVGHRHVEFDALVDLSLIHI